MIVYASMEPEILGLILQPLVGLLIYKLIKKCIFKKLNPHVDRNCSGLRESHTRLFPIEANSLPRNLRPRGHAMLAKMHVWWSVQLQSPSPASKRGSPDRRVVFEQPTVTSEIVLGVGGARATLFLNLLVFAN